MSASEKLKALDERVRQMPQTTIESMDYHEAKNAVADALPQIVALVKAVEAVREAYMRGGDCREYPLVPLYFSIDRLEETLS